MVRVCALNSFPSLLNFRHFSTASVAEKTVPQVGMSGIPVSEKYRGIESDGIIILSLPNTAV